MGIFDTASSVMTVISFITFIGIIWWAFTPANRGNFEQAASLPFAEDDKAAGESAHV
ncbi:cbb3-type cytochrome c oxidase subunit 3 [Massilia solisilvae]|uniref:Cbb3-type cytochrome c oxidase subunit 3 n=1 Tax=Massilia solisilvae TaxID=1811225 RepID=A0ABT2BGQ9_9BURK|nr:cbb3-type cytochrome c oxidase subunit 3 [Massilia solisilvae]MCS0607705.1 cbb3-type cytochrome c oxidase subunit 3 [Massilia solisilvae]